MFDYLRVAALAAMTLGAAGGASGQILPVNFSTMVAASAAQQPEPLASAQTEVPTETIGEAAEPAESLAELVARESSSETADAEQECLAIVTYFESKGEPLAGQLAVAQVVLNRVDSGRFASTVCGVVKQRGQFSFVRGGVLPSVARDSANWRKAVAIARIAEAGSWEAPAAKALFFHAKRVSPGWKMTRLAAVGNHVFYR